MIARLLISPFGSIWNLKRRCLQARNSLWKKLLTGLYYAYMYENNSFIAVSATFHGVPCLPHGVKGIFVSSDTVVGRNCVIFQQVTIGSNWLIDSGSLGAPVVGDNCYIGAGAKIVGRVRIGHNVRIGANAVVYRDVPDNSVVVGAEQRTIPKSDPLDNRFFRFEGRWTYYDDGQWIAVADDALIAKLDQQRLEP